MRDESGGDDSDADDMSDDPFFASGSGLGSGSAGGAGWSDRAVARFPMYPHVEHVRSWDTYGQPIEVDEFKKIETAHHALGDQGDGSGVAAMDVDHKSDGASSAQHSKAANAEAQEAEESDWDDDDDDDDGVPTKVVTKQVRVPIKCSVRVMRMDGRSDGRSLKKILNHVNPRKLILVRGEAQAKESLKEYCLKEKVSQQVLVPAKNQLVDVTSQDNVYRISLSDSFVSKLRFVAVEDYELAFAEGTIKLDYEQSALPILDAAQSAVGHRSVFLGDVTMARVKGVLNRAGVPATFMSGVLVCDNGTVNIRKVAENKISLQGALCPAYFRIRTHLHGLFEIV
eukprot:TRINITY_DN66392_c9_g9_i1.p2 TRINITY_DN66392_c9_g9~~TRINITY_DN66392_c9_g9_i1.p2  ORF type:complete len:358 (-),score=189.24 TRINITY_DN66392_c9_g9_i1:85-1107(-)